MGMSLRQAERARKVHRGTSRESEASEEAAWGQVSERAKRARKVHRVSTVEGVWRAGGLALTRRMGRGWRHQGARGHDVRF